MRKTRIEDVPVSMLRQWLDDCLHYGTDLSDWDKEFLASQKRRRQAFGASWVPTTREAVQLARIHTRSMPRMMKIP